MSSRDEIIALTDDSILSSDWDMLCMEVSLAPPLEPVYRIPERDERNSPAPKYREGDFVEFRRCVVRIGYEFGVHSVTKRQWFETGVEIVAKETGAPAEEIKKIIVTLGLSSPFKGIKGRIYQQLIEPLTHSGANKNVRAMWFYDFPEPQIGQIDTVVTKLTGYRSPGYYSGSSYYGYGDYEPPYLDQRGRQRLYKVSITDSHAPHSLFVYPDDVLENR